jgi:hypothetical protein
VFIHIGPSEILEMEAHVRKKIK